METTGRLVTSPKKNKCSNFVFFPLWQLWMFAPCCVDSFQQITAHYVAGSLCWKCEESSAPLRRQRSLRIFGFVLQSRQLESETGTTEEHSLNKEARKWATRVAREHKNIIHSQRVGIVETHQGPLLRLVMPWCFHENSVCFRWLLYILYLFYLILPCILWLWGYFASALF